MILKVGSIYISRDSKELIKIIHIGIQVDDQYCVRGRAQDNRVWTWTKDGLHVNYCITELDLVEEVTNNHLVKLVL